jgi:glutaconate CoA-transferase subunit A
MAAKRRFMTCERIVETEDFAREGTFHTLRINRMLVDGVIEAPNGAHFTSCMPDYPRDESFLARYAASASSTEAWQAFRGRYLDGSESEYQREVRAS